MPANVEFNATEKLLHVKIPAVLALDTGMVVLFVTATGMVETQFVTVFVTVQI